MPALRPARPSRRRSPRSARSGRRGAGSRGRCGRRRGAAATPRRRVRTYSGRPLTPRRRRRSAARCRTWSRGRPRRGGRRSARRRAPRWCTGRRCRRCRAASRRARARGGWWRSPRSSSRAAVELAHAHAAEPLRGYLQQLLGAELARVHTCSFRSMGVQRCVLVCPLCSRGAATNQHSRPGGRSPAALRVGEAGRSRRSSRVAAGVPGEAHARRRRARGAARARPRRAAPARCGGRTNSPARTSTRCAPAPGRASSPAGSKPAKWSNRCSIPWISSASAASPSRRRPCG